MVWTASLLAPRDCETANKFPVATSPSLSGFNPGNVFILTRSKIVYFSLILTLFVDM
jgi:hypothetical protein